MVEFHWGAQGELVSFTMALDRVVALRAPRFGRVIPQGGTIFTAVAVYDTESVDLVTVGCVRDTGAQAPLSESVKSVEIVDVGARVHSESGEVEGHDLELAAVAIRPVPEH